MGLTDLNSEQFSFHFHLHFLQIYVQVTGCCGSLEKEKKKKAQNSLNLRQACAYRGEYPSKYLLAS